MDVTVGAAQGSMLGPLCFIPYINAIFFLPLKGPIQLYPGDAAIVFSGKTLLV